MLNNKVLERLNNMLEKFNSLNKKLESEDINSDIDRLRKIMKQKNELEDIVLEYTNLVKISKIIEEDKKLLKHEKDEELTMLLKEEIKNNEHRLLASDIKIQKLLIPNDPNDKKNVIIEIRGAVGGDEANIFAGDLYKMYIRYADEQR